HVLRPSEGDRRAEATRRLEPQLRLNGKGPVPPFGTSEVVDIDPRNHGHPVIADDEQPWREVWILSHRWPPARRAVIVRRAELAKRPAHVPLPVVPEGDVDVRV